MIWHITHMWCSVTQLCPTVCDHMNCSLQGSSCPWNFSGKNIGVCCHFPTPGDHPNPGVEPASPESPALAGRFFTLVLPGRSTHILYHNKYFKIYPKKFPPIWNSTNLLLARTVHNSMIISRILDRYLYKIIT